MKLKRSLIGLLIALVVGSASSAWADTISWPFTTGGNYAVSDATKVEVADDVARLIAVDQTDDDNTSTGFGGGTHSQTQWDSGNNWLELQAGQTSGDFISRVIDAGATATWDSISWTPQRPLYKELPNNRGIEPAYPTGNADMTGNVLLMHLNESPATHGSTISDSSGEGNHGTFMTNEGATDKSVTGKLKAGLSLDGADDYVNVPDDPSLGMTAAVTIEAWVNPSVGGGQTGDIRAVIDTLEFDPVDGVEPDIVHVSGNVYAVAYRGKQGDGFLTTFEIADDGLITDTPIDELEFDTVDGIEPDICHVSGDVFAIAYKGENLDGFLKTVEISTGGLITDTVIDTLEFDPVDAAQPKIIHVSGDVYAIAYKGANLDGFLKTVEISTGGLITDTVIDTLEFDPVDAAQPEIIQISQSVYAIAYEGVGSNGFLKTIAIAADGTITDTVIDTLVFDALFGLTPNMAHVYGDVFIIAYEGEAGDGFLKTVEIASNGVITDTVIDTLEFDTLDGRTPHMTHCSGGVFAVSYEGVLGDGFLKTVDISSNGLITDTVIDSLEFDTRDGHAPQVLHVHNNVFLYAYEGEFGDGFLSTVEMIKNKGVMKPDAYGLTADPTSAYGVINNQTISGPVSAGWNHIVLTYDKDAASDQQKLYINGALAATATLTDPIATNTYDINIGDLMSGDIDEVAIYNRSLAATEVDDHYKRGILRLKYQVRSGSTNPPTGSFLGPDSTSGTYYSELSNNTTGLPSLELTNVANNQYFQYKAYLETDNSSNSPELKSVVIGPTHYPTDNPTVENNTGLAYVGLTSFAETLGAGNQGSVRYQISNNGTSWYYWNGANWVAASGYSQTNTAAEINTNCGQFYDDVGTGDFYFKAFLHSDTASQQVELDQVDLDYALVVLSVSVSNSTFAFGTNSLNTWLDPDTSVIINDGEVAEDFVGRISQFTDGVSSWGISSSANGIDTVRAQWSTTSESGPWTDISAYDTDFTIATNVAVDDSVSVWFRIQTPTASSSYEEHSSTLTVTAQQY